MAAGIALALGLTGFGTGWLALNRAREALTEQVRGIATRVAQKTVDDLGALPSLDPAIVRRILLELDASTGEIATIALLGSGPEAPAMVAASNAVPQEESIALAADAMREGRLLVREADDSIRVAAPVHGPHAAGHAVVVRADLGPSLVLQQRAVEAVVGFAVLAVGALVLLMDLLAWPLVHKPIQQLRETMARVTAGDFAARAPVARRDEIGAVAEGLNEMLAQLETLNDQMQTQVRGATEELQQKNQQLVESYHRLFTLREQLANAEQLASVGQTAANVAHQVGTPLNLISGYVQLLKEELGPDSEHTARLAIIEEQIAKVTTTVRSLLDRSRPMGRKTRTTAGELVNRVVEVMLPSLGAAGIAHEMELPAGTTPILVDATNLELALLNLMSNAADAMPKGGTLRVRVVDGAPGRVRIEIADTGHGIPDDLLPRIFEPWVSTKKPGRGTGLGLPIARDVVAGHGGTISVSSTVGVGTTFTIDLPSDAARDVGRAAS